MRKYNLYQIDSFTKTKFTGNPAGVITNADGLTETQMQQIARELNNSETAFIFQPDEEGYDIHVRFFTPTREVPICGHATIAAHYARAIENNLGTTRVYHKTGVGILPVDIIKEDNDYKIVMTQGEIGFSEVLEEEIVDNILNALYINAVELIGDCCPIQIASTGHSKVMIGIKNNDVLHSLNPNMDMLSSISKTIGCNGFYVFTINENDSILIRGRMFAPAIGINEDPVTGNANGPLGAYLVHHNLVKHDNETFSFTAVQGEAMKRAGKIDVQVKIKNNQPIEVKIAGNAVIVFKSELCLCI